MGSHGVTGRQLRMLKVIGWIVSHTEAIHDSPGSGVCRHGERYQLPERESLKAVANDGFRTFGRQAMAPGLGGEPPANFHAWSKGCLKGWHRESDKTYEAVALARFHSAQTEAMLLEMAFYPLYKQITLFSRKDLRKELHYLGICVHASEGFVIGFPPAAQNQALGGYKR